MDPTVANLIQAVREERLDDATKTSNLKTSDLADRVSKEFDTAFDARNGDVAMTLAYIASHLYAQLNDQDNRLKYLIAFAQIRFMVANTAEEYDSVRETALQIVKISDQFSVSKRGFEGAVLAADCTFFATEADKWPLTGMFAALRDVIAACDRADGFQGSRHFSKLVDLLATVASKSMPRVVGETEQTEKSELLKTLAARVDQLIPADFECWGNPPQDSKIASILATLTDEYA
jgi:hypothetical protein